MTDTIQNSEGVEDAFNAGWEAACDVHGNGVPGKQEAIAAYLEEARHSLAREPATADVERAARFVEDGYRCRTCNAVFLADEGHPQPECSYPNWDALTDEGKAEAIRALSRAAPSSERCSGCDGTGDMVLPDGEWMGICPCPAGDRLRAPSSEPAIAEGERWREALRPFAFEGVTIPRGLDRDLHWFTDAVTQRSFTIGQVLDAREALAQSSTPPAIANTDLPDRFETWWRAHPQHNRNPATYADKKQIAWDAFYVATVSATSTPPASKGVEVFHPDDLLTPEDAWQELVEYTDRTSPEEYPDMALITRDELIDFIHRAVLPTPSNDTLQGRGEVERLLSEARKNFAITIRTMECNSDDVRTAEAIIRFLEKYA